jgi:hypothetical protein
MVILSDDITVTVKFTVGYRRIVTAEFGLVWTTKNPQAFIHAGFCISLDVVKRLIGGAAVKSYSQMLCMAGVCEFFCYICVKNM